MSISERERRRVAGIMKAIGIAGMILAALGAAYWGGIYWKVASLEKEHKRVRASQFQVRVSQSRNHHPHNQYLQWGPQTVWRGYVGKDPRDKYDRKIAERLSYLPATRRITFAGLGIALVGAAALLSVRRRRVVEQPPPEPAHEPSEWVLPQ